MTRPRFLHIATTTLFVVMLLVPWIAGLGFGASADTVERRRPAPMPIINRETVFDREMFAGVSDYVRDRTPLRGTAAGAVSRTWLSFGASPSPRVMDGPRGTLFLAEDFTNHCVRPYSPGSLTQALDRFNTAADTGGKEWLFIIPPDKGAVLDHRLSGRADLAAACSRGTRADFAAELDSAGVSVDLVGPLAEADQAEPGRWYYEHDSHWTFDGGSLAAGVIVDHLSPGLWDPTVLAPTGRTLPIRGDIYARMGIERRLEVPDEQMGAMRPDVETTRDEGPLLGTRTVRTYSSTGAGGVVAGTTLLVHDSMMNFTEQQLAPYFEEIVFIHWDDLEQAGFFDRLAAGDRVIFASVGRSVHSRVNTTLLNATFGDRLDQALRG